MYKDGKNIYFLFVYNNVISDDIFVRRWVHAVGE